MERYKRYFKNAVKLQETGEWNEEEGAPWKEWLRAQAEDICSMVEGCEVEDVKGFDMYQGPVAYMTCPKGSFELWSNEHDTVVAIARWLKPVANNDPGKEVTSVKGVPEDIADAINSLPDRPERQSDVIDRIRRNPTL